VPPASKPRLGISACLLGQPVRYDGGHKLDPFCADVLSPFVEWVPVCPEIEVGMPVPRPAIRLTGRAGAPRLVEPKSGEDWTARMDALAASRVAALAKLDLAGFVLKRSSPSCGLLRVRVHGPRGGAPRRDGTGLFARALVERLPLLPVEEEGRLHDPLLRESFIERVFAFQRWEALRQGGLTPGRLVAFHAAHELALLAHSPDGHRRLGRLLAGAKGRPAGELGEAYGALFMASLARPATRGRHLDVLQHMAGSFKRAPAADRRELEEAVRDFGRGHLPLVVPLTLFRSQVRRHGVGYLAGQTYLDPDPRELLLRNHV